MGKVEHIRRTCAPGHGVYWRGSQYPYSTWCGSDLTSCVSRLGGTCCSLSSRVLNASTMERARHLCLCALPPAHAMVHDLEQPFSPRLLCSHAASGLAQQARRPPAYNHGSNGIPRISAAISGRVNGVDNMLHSLSDRMRTSRCGHLLDGRTALVSLGMRRPIRPVCCRYKYLRISAQDWLVSSSRTDRAPCDLCSTRLSRAASLGSSSSGSGSLGSPVGSPQISQLACFEEEKSLKRLAFVRAQGSFWLTWVSFLNSQIDKHGNTLAALALMHCLCYIHCARDLLLCDLSCGVTSLLTSCTSGSASVLHRVILNAYALFRADVCGVHHRAGAGAAAAWRHQRAGDDDERPGRQPHLCRVAAEREGAPACP